MRTKILTTILCLCAAISLNAQELKKSGRSVDELLPSGWTCQEARGDLYHNGRDDLAMIVLPNHKEKIQVREDGYELNLNQPLLAIYYMSEEGDLIQREVYDQLIPVPDEYTSIDSSISVNKKGALVIDLSYFFSAGSYDSPNYTYVFRYQNNDFYLIGEELTSHSRATGEGERISTNYLTHKECRSTFNVFKDSQVTPTERWKKIPAKPLQKMGSLTLGN